MELSPSEVCFISYIFHFSREKRRKRVMNNQQKCACGGYLPAIAGDKICSLTVPLIDAFMGLTNFGNVRENVDAHISNYHK